MGKSNSKVVISGNNDTNKDANNQTGNPEIFHSSTNTEKSIVNHTLNNGTYSKDSSKMFTTGSSQTRPVYSGTRTVRIRESSQDVSEQPKLVDIGVQTGSNEKPKKEKIRQELKERKSEIKAMSSTAEKLCNVCRTSGLAPLVDGSDCSLCPEDFTTNLRFVEKYVITQNYELSRIQSERDMAMNRLSSIAGDRLTHNNPNITNLGDKKRPTKLAELYKDLYDNEWTDAMETLEKKFSKSHENVKNCVYHLFSAIKVVYRTCQQKSLFQLRMITEHFFLLKFPSHEQIDGTWIDYPSERNRIIECRKNAADGMILNLQKTITDDDVFLNEIIKCEPQLDQSLLEEVVATDYFRKCVELCWLFVIQDPPLYLETESLKGQLLNKDLYTEYTKPGKVISYVVWPALYLHQDEDNTNGPLLAKGVAQPK